MIKVQADKVMAKIGKDADKIGNVVSAKITEYKHAGHKSKKGIDLVALPSRNLGINKYIIETYQVNPDVAFKVVEMIGEKTGKFKVGFAPFGSLLYLPADYRGNGSTIDFADLLK